MSKELIVIFGMAMVTYLPRLLPFLLLTNRQIPKRCDAFLRCIPPAALGALIVPGVFSATPEFSGAALFGVAFTAVYGLIRGGIIVPVLGSVAIAWLALALAS